MSEPPPIVLRGAAPQWHLVQDALLEADTPPDDSIITINTTLPVCSHPAVAPTDHYLYLEPNLSDEGVIKHIEKRKCFDHWEKHTELLLFPESIPWSRQWYLSVSIRKKPACSGVVCYLFYRIFSATREKDCFLPNPQGFACRSSGLVVFSGTLQRPRPFHQRTVNECPLKHDLLFHFPEANTMVFSTKEETLTSKSGFWVATNMTHCSGLQETKPQAAGYQFILGNPN